MSEELAINGDAWQLATPQQLLTLLQRLGVSGSEVARWLRVSRSSVSMWRKGIRQVPRKHVPVLRERTCIAYDHARELQAKAAALAPTETLQQAIRAEFAALCHRWNAEVMTSRAHLQWQVRDACAQLCASSAQHPFTQEAYQQSIEALATLETAVKHLAMLDRSLPQPYEEFHS